MPFQISPFGNDQFFTANGIIATGYKLFTYLAGTTQKEPVYTDINGIGSHTNPIILNAIGMPPSPIFLAIAKRYKFVYATPTDTDPPASPLYTADGLDVGFNITSTPAVEWVAGTTPTFLTGSSFSVVGDQTSIYHVGRRVQLVSNLGTRFGTITNSVFGATTVITVALDAGALDSTLLSVFYGFLSANGSSWPAGFNTGLTTSFNGPVYVPPFSNFNLIPIGMVMALAAADLPLGFLFCDGSAVSRITYADLFGAIGTVYGVGDGGSTFNVPDYRGRFPLGMDNMGGAAAGRVTAASLNGVNAIVLGGVGGLQNHQLIVSELPAHSHEKTYLAAANSDEAGATNTTSVKRSDFAVRTAGGDQSHNNMPPWIAMNYIIRHS